MPNVDDVARVSASQERLVEDDLLGVRQQLSMPGEVKQLRPASRHVQEGNEHGQ